MKPQKMTKSGLALALILGLTLTTALGAEEEGFLLGWWRTMMKYYNDVKGANRSYQDGLDRIEKLPKPPRHTLPPDDMDPAKVVAKDPGEEKVSDFISALNESLTRKFSPRDPTNQAKYWFMKKFLEQLGKDLEDRRKNEQDSRILDLVKEIEKGYEDRATFIDVVITYATASSSTLIPYVSANYNAPTLYERFLTPLTHNFVESLLQKFFPKKWYQWW